MGMGKSQYVGFYGTVLTVSVGHTGMLSVIINGWLQDKVAARWMLSSQRV